MEKWSHRDDFACYPLLKETVARGAGEVAGARRQRLKIFQIPLVSGAGLRSTDDE